MHLPTPSALTLAQLEDIHGHPLVVLQGFNHNTKRVELLDITLVGPSVTVPIVAWFNSLLPPSAVAGAVLVGDEQSTAVDLKPQVDKL
jgi:hypothetical protein